MPDREHERRTAEDVQLTEFDALGFVAVARGAQDHEQRLAVPLQLGPLVGDDRVFDSQLVQVELLCCRVQLGVVRPVHPDPRHRRRVGQARECLRQRGRGGRLPAVAVDGAVDHRFLRRRRFDGPAGHRVTGVGVGQTGGAAGEEGTDRTQLRHDTGLSRESGQRGTALRNTDRETAHLPVERFQLVLGGWLLIGCHTSLLSRKGSSRPRRTADRRTRYPRRPATTTWDPPPCRSRIRRLPRRILGGQRITTERPS